MKKFAPLKFINKSIASGCLAIFLLSLPLYALAYDVQDWSGYQGNSNHTGHQNVAISTNSSPIEIWNKKIGSGMSEPVITGKNVIMSIGNTLLAMNKYSGRIQWIQDYGQKKFQSSPVLAEGLIIARSLETVSSRRMGKVNAINVNNGKLLFEVIDFTLGENYYAPVSYSGQVYSPCDAGAICAYDITSQKLIWEKGLGFAHYIDWTPTVTEKYVITLTDVLRVFDRKNGEELFKIGTPNNIIGFFYTNGAPVYTEDSYVIYLQKNKLRAVDIHQRKLIWEKESDFAAHQPIVSKNTIYLTEFGNLVARDKLTGNKIWEFAGLDGYIYPKLAANNVIFIADDYKTYALDLATQKIFWSIEATGSLALSSDGILYITDNITRQLTAIKFSVSEMN